MVDPSYEDWNIQVWGSRRGDIGHSLPLEVTLEVPKYVDWLRGTYDMELVENNGTVHDVTGHLPVTAKNMASRRGSASSLMWKANLEPTSLGVLAGSSTGLEL